MAIGTTVTVGFNATKVQAGFRKISAGFKRMTSGFKNAGRAMLAPFVKLMAIAAPLIGVGAGFMLLKNASGQAADLEMMAVAFETLLGSAAAAGDRIRELMDFSVKTPFEPMEVIATSKLLQTLGGDIIATGDGLRMVGDAAAVANQPLEEVALHIGRIFGALTSGTSAGESIARLQELGLISGTAKLRFQELAEAQKKGKVAALSQTEAMQVLGGVLAKTSGAMDKLSTTFSGRISTLKGNWNQLLATMGSGLNEGLGSVVDDLNAWLPTLTESFRDMGAAMGTFIKAIKNMFKSGELGDFIWTGLEYAGLKFGELLMGLMDAAVARLLDQLGKAGIGDFQPLTTEAEQMDGLDFGNGPGKTTINGRPINTGEALAGARDIFGSAAKGQKISDMFGRAAVQDEQTAWLKKMGWTLQEIKEATELQTRFLRRSNPAFP